MSSSHIGKDKEKPLKTEIDRRYTGPNVVTYNVTLSDGGKMRLFITDPNMSAWDALIDQGIDPDACYVELAK